MDKITVIHDPERHKLIIYRNGKLAGGISGILADKRFKAIQAECEKHNILFTIIHGSEVKEKKV